VNDGFVVVLDLNYIGCNIRHWFKREGGLARQDRDVRSGITMLWLRSADTNHFTAAARELICDCGQLRNLRQRRQAADISGNLMKSVLCQCRPAPLAELIPRAILQND
jgi:hypothetical protein